MKIPVLNKLFFLVVLTFYCIQVYGQSLPVGIPVLEDTYRREQLLGTFDELTSFAIRPLFPSLINKKLSFDSSIIKDDKVLFKLLPVTFKQQYNTDHPEGQNDGSMIPARGYQNMVTGGIFAKYKWINIQLMPEFVYAENRVYQGFPDELSNYDWNVYYTRIINTIDKPERFGKSSFIKSFLGQSSISLNLNPISIGISNENIWWGPGIQNALLMTNNAPGFKHFTLNTVSPIRTKIGSFEGQLVCGRLDASGYLGIDTLRLYHHGVKYIKKPDDWRYYNGLSFTYQPLWLPGLFLGAARSSIRYNNEKGGNFYDDYLPVLKVNFLKELFGFDMNLDLRTDELASVFLRWVAPKSHLELYFEYGREDHNLDMTDLLLELEYSNAYILGFRKLIILKNRINEIIDIQAEVTHLEKNVFSLNRAPNDAMWYVHNLIYDGYTNIGQNLGAGIGPSSSMQSLKISWVRDFKRIGMELKRVSYDENFWYIVSRDPKSHWIDIGSALIGEWDYKQFLINTKIQLVGSQNYQYLYTPGKITYNLHTELGITYLFK